MTDAAKRVVVATGNRHKVEEIEQALASSGWEFCALRDLGDFPEPVEDGETFEDNARIKARAAFENTGLASLADDSGLVVDALGGRPGVHSSRYAGEHATDAENNAKLLVELADVPHEKRTARFVSVMVFIDEDGTETVAQGACEGYIATEPQGDGGFGYDPLFHPLEVEGQPAMAELSMAQKNAISHRGKALVNLRALLGHDAGEAVNG